MKRRKQIFPFLCVILAFIFMIDGTICFSLEDKLTDEQLLRMWTFKTEDANLFAKILRKNNEKIFVVTLERKDNPFVSGKDNATERGAYHAGVDITFIEAICQEVVRGYGFNKLFYHSKLEKPNGNIITLSYVMSLSDCREYVEKKIKLNEFLKRIRLLSK